MEVEGAVPFVLSPTSSHVEALYMNVPSFWNLTELLLPTLLYRVDLLDCHLCSEQSWFELEKTPLLQKVLFQFCRMSSVFHCCI